jgi:outer membrane protein insertion porin family
MISFRPTLLCLCALLTATAVRPQNPPAGQQQAAAASKIVERIEFRGARRIPQDTLRTMISSKPGDVYNEDALQRDLLALWNTKRLDDIRIETEKGDRGGVVVRFVLTERAAVRTIQRDGAKTVATVDILDRYRER